MELALTLPSLDDTSPVGGEAVRRDSGSNVRALDPLAGLARAAQRGDGAATRRLLEALGPRLLRTVRGVLGASHPELDDALQEALIALVRALPAFRGEGDVTGYAVRITLRASIAARRRYRARAPEPEAEEGAADASQPSEVSAARRREIFRRLLEELPEAQAEALVLRVVLGHSLEETAAIAGAPENTIRSRIRLAREGLKKRIEAEGLSALLEVET